jgi:hypothetical protein
VGTGRDVRQQATGSYDHLRVECAWRVSNPNR